MLSCADSTRKQITESSGTITVRAVNVCGQIGLSNIECVVGVTIGPPLESIYAVEPVGVATIVPSQVNFDRNSPFTNVFTLNIRDELA